MKEQAKQLVKSKRMGFTALLTAAWIVEALGEAEKVRVAAEQFAGNTGYAQWVGIGMGVAAIVGMAWTKIYDDKQNGN